tara:strand:- start:1793 stop:2182 length:390 start_codon:yes stop_codon:yes gene_type:complete
MIISKISDNKLTELCVELLSKTYLDLGQHNVDGKMKVLMAQSLCFDLKESYPTFLWIDVKRSFWNGVRNSEEFSVNAKTWTKWLKAWRKIIWDSNYNVEVLGQKPSKYYRPKQLNINKIENKNESKKIN